MHSIVTSLYAAILFFLLSPGVLLSIPPKGSKITMAAVHAVVFMILYYYTHRYVYQIFTTPMKQAASSS